LASDRGERVPPVDRLGDSHAVGLEVHATDRANRALIVDDEDARLDPQPAAVASSAARIRAMVDPLAPVAALAARPAGEWKTPPPDRSSSVHQLAGQ
jgi:hypothetical protein